MTHESAIKTREEISAWVEGTPMAEPVAVAMSLLDGRNDDTREDHESIGQAHIPADRSRSGKAGTVAMRLLRIPGRRGATMSLQFEATKDGVSKWITWYDDRPVKWLANNMERFES